MRRVSAVVGRVRSGTGFGALEGAARCSDRTASRLPGSLDRTRADRLGRPGGTRRPGGRRRVRPHQRCMAEAGTVSARRTLLGLRHVDRKSDGGLGWLQRVRGRGSGGVRRWCRLRASGRYMGGSVRRACVSPMQPLWCVDRHPYDHLGRNRALWFIRAQAGRRSRVGARTLAGPDQPKPPMVKAIKAFPVWRRFSASS
jgi:hypothetical protein